jgi:epoxyqueuosine reductase
MVESLKREIAQHADQAAFVPIHRLQNLRQDIEALKGRADLNNFQRYIINDLYSLDVPETDFEIRSILLVAAPSPSTINLLFTRAGKRIPVLLPASYADKAKSPARIEDYLKAFLNPRGYHIRYAPQLPHKLLAVRSGLGRYGRNNICYVEGMGSFLNLAPYFSDIPCMEDAWQDIRQMDRCNTCRACLQNCPTAAIMPTRFLINNERCLTYFNEAGAEWDFPEWIDPSSHHTLYGCLRCQTVCPINEPYLKPKKDPVEFSEEETAFLLEGKPFELFPENLKQKVQTLDMMSYLGAIPRNLRVLFNQIA